MSSKEPLYQSDAPPTEADSPYEATKPLVIAMDVNGVVTHVNQEFIDVSGFHPDELIGLSHDVTWHSDMPIVSHIDFWLTVKRGKLHRGMVKRRRNNGSFFWTESITPP